MRHCTLEQYCIARYLASELTGRTSTAGLIHPEKNIYNIVANSARQSPVYENLDHTMPDVVSRKG